MADNHIDKLKVAAQNNSNDEASFFQISNPKNKPNDILKSQSTYISRPIYPYSQKSLGEQQREPQATPYHKWDRIEKLAKRLGNKGVTFRDVMREFKVGKQTAIYTLQHYQKNGKYGRKGGKLYSAGRRIPQRYYLTSKEAEFHYLESTHIDRGGVGTRDTRHYNLNRHTNPLNRFIDYSPPPSSEDADGLLDAFLKSNLAMSTSIQIHNPKIKLKLHDLHPDVDDPYYRVPDSYLAPGKEGTRNRTKLLTETVGDKEITYRLSPNETVYIEIGCSDNPFPLSEREHADSLHDFMRGRRERLRIWLTDRLDQFVPQVEQWSLVGYELGIDTPITGRLAYEMSYKGDHMTLRNAGKTFRDYVKWRDNRRPFLRREQTLGDNKQHKPVPLTKEALYGLMATMRPTFSPEEQEQEREEAR